MLRHLIRKLIDTAVLHFGELDILILNAGISAHAKFEDIKDMSIFRSLIDINFFGYVYPTRYKF